MLPIQGWEGHLDARQRRSLWAHCGVRWWLDVCKQGPWDHCQDSDWETQVQVEGNRSYWISFRLWLLSRQRMHPRSALKRSLRIIARSVVHGPSQPLHCWLQVIIPDWIPLSYWLNEEDQKIFQPLIVAPQWVIQIGHFDIATSVMTLLCFCAVPRQGHLDHIKRIHGCLSKMCHATIKIRTDAPDCSAYPIKMCDWDCSCYADAK